MGSLSRAPMPIGLDMRWDSVRSLVCAGSRGHQHDHEIEAGDAVTSWANTTQ